MASRPPNVIVFFTDQQRWDTSGLAGNPMGLTPNFDREARAGTYLPNSFTCQPVCGPARSCLQTGQYATTTGCWKNGIPLATDADTIAKRFRAAGYQTGYVGKWHLASEKFAVTKEAERGGYEEWLAANALEHSSDAYDCVVYDEENQEVKLPGYRVDALTDASIRFIDRHQDKPFLLFQSLLEPHHQNCYDNYPAPSGYEEGYRSPWTPPDLAELGGSAHRHLPGYYGMVKRCDEAFGRMMDALTSLGLRENTIVCFTSDHGCHFKTRNNEYKRSAHEASIRVPTLLTGGPFRGGGQRSELVSLVDLPPTLLAAAGLEVPESMEGNSLVPRLRDPEAAWPEEVFIQISEAETARSIRTDRWKYAVRQPGSAWDQRSEGYVPEPSPDHYEETFLYDLQADPYELENLIDSAAHDPVKAKLRERLQSWIHKVEGKGVTIAAAPSWKRGQMLVDLADGR